MLRCFLLLIWVMAACAQDTPPRHDFAIVMDNSISMADRKASAASSVRDLVASGFGEQIEEGDEIHLLTGDGETFATFAWVPTDKEAIASDAANHLRAVKFQRGTRLEGGLARVIELSARAKALLAVVLTDGEEPLAGFTFDAEINRDLPKMRRVAAQIKRPVLIALLARDGVWADWRASAGIARPKLPRLPVREHQIAQASAPAPIQLPPPEPEPMPAPEPVTFFYPPGAKIIAAHMEPLSALESQEHPARPQELVDTKAEVVLEQTEPEVALAVQEPAQAPPPERNVENQEPARHSTEIEALPETPAPLPPSTAEPAPGATPAPAAESVSARNLEASTAPLQTNVATVVPTHPSRLSVAYITLAAGGVSLLALSALLMFRGNSTAPDPQSLISRSLAK